MNPPPVLPPAATAAGLAPSVPQVSVADTGKVSDTDHPYFITISNKQTDKKKQVPDGFSAPCAAPDSPPARAPGLARLLSSLAISLLPRLPTRFPIKVREVRPLFNRFHPILETTISLYELKVDYRQELRVRTQGVRSCLRSSIFPRLGRLPIPNSFITLLVPQSRFGDKPLGISAVCPRNRTSVLERVERCFAGKGLGPLGSSESVNVRLFSQPCTVGFRENRR